MSTEDTIKQPAVATGLCEIGRLIVTAWLEVRGVNTLQIGDAADLMERVGAAIEAERWELQSRLAQLEKERSDLQERLAEEIAKRVNESAEKAERPIPPRIWPKPWWG